MTMTAQPKIDEVAETLVENGATYVATNVKSLVDEPAQFYYHLPAGTPDDQKEAIAKYLDEEVGYRPHDQQSGAIRIADRTVPSCVHSVLLPDLHLYRREPVYVIEGMAGLDSVTIEDGVTNIREIVATQPVFEPRPAKTVALEDLVRELAAAGAVSVELAHDFLVGGEQTVELRIPMVPADGKPIVGPVSSVKVAGETYPLNSTLTMSGPYGSNPSWTALYVCDNVRGLDPLPVKKGVEAGRKVISRASEVDSMSELVSHREQ
jgi:hypothetical protein